MTCSGVKRPVGPPMHCEGCSEKNTHIEGDQHFEVSPQQAYEDAKATLTKIVEIPPAPMAKKASTKK